MIGYETRINDTKIAAVDALKEMFSEGKDYIFADYRGMTVLQISRLRQTLREAGADFHVVKNTFAKIAFQQMEKPDVSDYLVGPTAVAISRSDATPVLKAILDFGKESPVQVKGAMVGADVYGPAQVEALSKLPSREVLISQLMSVMQAPLQNFVYALNGVPTKLARTLQAVADQKAQG